MMLISDRKKGFTLVELMISMTFISMLLLAIAMLILQITSIYNKGLTMRDVNQAGQLISGELQRSLNQTYTEEVVYVSLPGGSGGRLCAGTTVYAWNYNENLNDGNAINKIDSSSDVRFVRFNGLPDEYCEVNGEGDWEPLPSRAAELLSEGNSNIALHEFDLIAQDVAEDSSQKIYSIRMIVGTTDTGLLTGNNCNAKDKIGDQRCAINEFSFTARSGDKEDA